MTTTKAERAADYERAVWILDNTAEHFRAGGLLLVSATYGSGTTDYFRTSAITYSSGVQVVSHLTWAMAKVFGYSLRDRRGYWALAIGGGNYSKPDELARSLANYYGVERVRVAIV